MLVGHSILKLCSYQASSISAQLKSHLKWCCEVVLPEVTSPGHGMKWRDRKSRDRKWSHAHAQPVPAFFYFHSSSTKCTIADLFAYYFKYIIGFFFIALWVLLLLLLLWSKRVWLLLVTWRFITSFPVKELSNRDKSYFRLRMRAFQPSKGIASGSRDAWWRHFQWKGPTKTDIAQHSVAMLLPVMRNGTLCTITIVREKRRNALPSMRRTYFGHMTSVASFPVMTQWRYFR
jgi:hypothetical protein